MTTTIDNEHDTTANVDAAELAKFSQLAHRWWDEGGEFKPLHQLNPLRLQWIADHLPFCLAGRQVVDVGCGGGILSEAMAVAGAQVLGIDLAAKSLQVARLHALEQGVTGLQYREIAAEALAREQPAAFDVVTCMEMLEHVPDPAAIVRACAQSVRPGGMVFFSTIARTPKAFALAVVAAEYMARLLPAGTHEYERFIKPSELAGHVRAAGLTVKDISGVAYNPLTERFSLSGDASVNYMMACQHPAAA